MNYKNVYNTANGFLEKAFRDPMRPHEFLIPGGCIESTPPTFDPETETCQYVDGSWEIKKKNAESEEEVLTQV